MSTSTKFQNKNAALVATIAIQLCMGVAYIWSVFQTGIANSLFGGDNATASLAYSMLLAVLSGGSVVGGIMVRKTTIKAVVMTGGFILSTGFFLASLATPTMSWLVFVGYGVFGGFGMGLAYSTTIAGVQRLFPEKKGFVTGLVVASLGLGGVVFTPIVEALIAAFGGQGVGELMAFRIMAIIFLVICTTGAMFLYTPASPATAAGGEVSKDLSPTKVLRRPEFYIITMSMMLACTGGLMMIGFAKPIAIGHGLVETATVGVLMISIFNAIGRLFWGTVSDKIGRVPTLIILMVGSGVMSLLVGVAKGNWIFVLIGCIGFFYGGLLSNYPTFTAEVFGAKYVATNYGMVLLGFGLAAIVSSYIAGYYKNIAADDISLMFPAFVIAAVCSVVAVGLILVVKRMQSNRG